MYSKASTLGVKKIGIIAICKSDDFEGFNKLQFSYVDMIEKSGAIAYIIPCNTTHIDHFIDELDGFVFPGADEDICPSLYGQESSGAKDCIIQNDRFLLDTLGKVFDAGKPIMGICKGHQLINIYFGGTLIQSLENSKKHLNLEKYGSVVHDIDISEDSFLLETFQTQTLGVNSAHHQSIDKLGNDLKITATCSDGVIEAIQHTTKPVYGFQWHPERMGELHLPIFKKFIEKI